MTDPAALLTRLEQAKQLRDVWQIGLAEQALEHAAPELAARVLELEAKNARLREANHKAFTDGMEAAAQICGSLAEVEYDDADGFEAATGCEAAIMRVVNEQRTEQALNKEPTL